MVEPIEENNQENNEQAEYFDVNGELDQWGDTGLYDQIIRKHNVKDKKAARYL